MKKQRNALHKAKRLVKGLVISWEDQDPLSDGQKVGAGKVSHRNPVYRLMAKDIFRGCGDWIVHQQPLRWLIKICVVFRYDNGVDQEEIRELEGCSTIDGLNEFCMEEIEDAFKHGNMGKYFTTKFEIECISTN